jgi:hypothetical protein
LEPALKAGLCLSAVDQAAALPPLDLAASRLHPHVDKQAAAAMFRCTRVHLLAIAALSALVRAWQLREAVDHSVSRLGLATVVRLVTFTSAVRNLSRKVLPAVPFQCKQVMPLKQVVMSVFGQGLHLDWKTALKGVLSCCTVGLVQHEVDRSPYHPPTLMAPGVPVMSA